MTTHNTAASETNRVEIIEPSEAIHEFCTMTINQLRAFIPNADIALSGSFAVPMAGQKEIDILIETPDVVHAQKMLESIGYRSGPVVDGEAFSRRRQNGFIIELHIVSPGHKKIRSYAMILNRLRADEKLRKEYEAFKRSLNGKTEAEYKAAKNAFLKKNKLV